VFPFTSRTFDPAIDHLHACLKTEEIYKVTFLLKFITPRRQHR